jgi:hypothetical protein
MLTIVDVTQLRQLERRRDNAAEGDARTHGLSAKAD